MKNTTCEQNSQSFYRPVTMPATKKEGLINFIQMVINQLEHGNTQEALLIAVDLINDVRFGVYDEIKVGNTMAALQGELEKKHTAELNSCREAAYKAGREDMSRDIAQKLGLI